MLTPLLEVSSGRALVNLNATPSLLAFITLMFKGLILMSSRLRIFYVAFCRNLAASFFAFFVKLCECLGVTVTDHLLICTFSGLTVRNSLLATPHSCYHCSDRSFLQGVKYVGGWSRIIMYSQRVGTCPLLLVQLSKGLGQCEMKGGGGCVAACHSSPSPYLADIHAGADVLGCSRGVLGA